MASTVSTTTTTSNNTSSSSKSARSASSCSSASSAASANTIGGGRRTAASYTNSSGGSSTTTAVDCTSVVVSAPNHNSTSTTNTTTNTTNTTSTLTSTAATQTSEDDVIHGGVVQQTNSVVADHGHQQQQRQYQHRQQQQQHDRLAPVSTTVPQCPPHHHHHHHHPQQPSYGRIAEACHRLTNPVSNHHHHHQPLHPNPAQPNHSPNQPTDRMTATHTDDTVTATATTTDTMQLYPSVKRIRVHSDVRVSLEFDRTRSPGDSMNLRNRPLKAATADSGHTPSGSTTLATIATTTSDIASSGATPPPTTARRPGRRRTSHVPTASSATTTTTSAVSSPSPHSSPPPPPLPKPRSLSSSSPSSGQSQLPYRSPAACAVSSPSATSSSSSSSIASYFPLTTIGSVCKLFRSQICPQSASHFSSDAVDRSTEPNLALLSIVIGVIEHSLTFGPFDLKKLDSSAPDSDQQHLRQSYEPNPKCVTGPTTVTTTTNNNASTTTTLLYPPPTTTTTSNGPNAHRNNGGGGHSPAEATTAPVVGGSFVPGGHHHHHHHHHHDLPVSGLDIEIPTVQYSTVEPLLDKFTTQIKESVDLSKFPKKTSRELIKKISEVIWSTLHRSYYKDRAHLQTLYSYLTNNRLDCYGVAYAVVAACQILGRDDVRLVMSEDHVWVVFGDENETCEVTWHGKGGDDRLGEPLPPNPDSWLFLKGNTMMCDRLQTVATLVSAMNPSLSHSFTDDSTEHALLQRQLLWILYECGHLARYPMALGNLGDLEDILSEEFGIRKPPILLFLESIECAKLYYRDSHVYPYTYLGGYYFRHGRFKGALKYWADAAQVMRRYNYSRDDEEIYKEFQDIANDLIPSIMRMVSGTAFLEDAECFAYLLRFYDGLCAWEEGSSTPVLHIGWTKPLVGTISKFSHSVRRQVAIKVDRYGGAGGGSGGAVSEDEFDSDGFDSDGLSDEGRHHHHHHHHHPNSTIGERRRRRAASFSSSSNQDEAENGHGRHSATGHHRARKSSAKMLENGTATKETSTITTTTPMDTDQAAVSPASDALSDREYRLWKKSNAAASAVSVTSVPSPVSRKRPLTESTMANNNNNNNNSSSNGGSPAAAVPMDSDSDADEARLATGKTTVAVLTSKKFAGLRSLLTASKLNTSAIQLQLTAQSQVNLRRNRSGTTTKGGGLCAELDFVSTTTTTLARTSSTSGAGTATSNMATKRIRVKRNSEN